MRGFAVAAGAVFAAMAFGGAAQAASIIDTSANTSVIDLVAAADKDLSNNSGYASGAGANAIGYLFDEGINLASSNATTAALGFAGQSVQSYLLHYDRQNGGGFFGGLATGSITGSFRIALAANESFAGLVGFTGNVGDSLDNANDLRDTDFLSGVTYANTSFTSTLFRGTEGTLLGDRITLTPDANSVLVDYRLTSTGSSLDEVRFFVTSVTAVPEPAAWALMIGGFGVVGGAMRQRPRPVVKAV